VSAEPDLAGLIAANRRGRSYQRIAEDSGGTITRNRVQQLANDPQRSFPTPDTIRGLARALSATETEVVAAAARSVGITVRYGQDPSALVIGRAGDLPGPARDAIVHVAHELLIAYTSGSEEVGRDGDAAPIGTVTDQRHRSRTSESSSEPRSGEDGTSRAPTSSAPRSDGSSKLQRGSGHVSRPRSSGRRPPRHT